MLHHPLAAQYGVQLEYEYGVVLQLPFDWHVDVVGEQALHVGALFAYVVHVVQAADLLHHPLAAQYAVQLEYVFGVVFQLQLDWQVDVVGEQALHVGALFAYVVHVVQAADLLHHPLAAQYAVQLQ